MLDTERYFVICANVLGGCMGTTGPKEIDPATGEPWALAFPVITIRDMVRAQKLLIDHLGIEQLFCVIGGSMGGDAGPAMGVELPRGGVRGGADRRRGAALGAEHRVPRGRPAGDHGRPGLVRRALSEPRAQPVARPRGGAHGGAHHLSFGAGVAPQVRPQPAGPQRGDLRVRRRFPGRELSAPPGQHFVDRFDANSYLYITRAMDYFDLAAEHGGSLPAAFSGTQPRFCLISFTSDWLFPTPESRALVHALNAVAANVSFVEIETDKGHDAFLLHEPELFATLRGFLTGCAEHRGLPLWSAHESSAALRSMRPRRRGTGRTANCAATCG